MKPEEIKAWLGKLPFMTKISLKAINDFDRHIQARNLAKNTRKDYLEGIYYTLREIRKPLEKIKLADMENYIIDNKGRLSYSTLRLRLISMKVVLKHMGRGDVLGSFKIQLGRAEKDKKAKRHDNIISRAMLKKLLEHTASNRDRVMFHFLFMSGCRIGELTNMTIKDIQFNGNGDARAYLSGKTGSRWIPLKDEGLVHALRGYVNDHPRRHEPDGPLWYSMANRNKYGAIDAPSIRYILRCTARRAGLKANIHPHAFRHSRASELGPYMTDRQLMRFFGWSSPAMCSVYVNQAAVDVENSVASADGGEANHKPIEQLKDITQKCPKCDNKKIPPGLVLCPSCGCGLNEDAKYEQTLIKIGKKLIKTIEKDPKKLDMLIGEDI